MHLDVAIDIVARGIISDVILDGDLPRWADYPEIGEGDWDAIHQRLGEMVGELQDEEYSAAYEMLAARAREWEKNNG